MKLAIACIVILTCLIAGAHSVKSGNVNTAAKCDSHGGVLRYHWDAGTLMGVTCDDYKRFYR